MYFTMKGHIPPNFFCTDFSLHRGIYEGRIHFIHTGRITGKFMAKSPAANKGNSQMLRRCLASGTRHSIGPHGEKLEISQLPLGPSSTARMVSAQFCSESCLIWIYHRAHSHHLCKSFIPIMIGFRV